MKTLFLAAIAISLVAGCGDDSGPGGGGGGGDNAGGDGGNGAGPEGGSGGDGGGAGGDPSCEEFLPMPGGPPKEAVTITITNNSALPVFIGSTQETCDDPARFHATTVGGDPVQIDRAACELTCADLATGGCECAAECEVPTVTMIHPGGSYATTWIKRVYEPTVMPDACYANEECVMDSCIQAQDPSEALLFVVDGYPDLADCTQAICDCDGGFAGSCTVEGATLVAGAPVAASSQWDLDDQTLSITFE